jgi:RHS repeat-associated protein
MTKNIRPIESAFDGLENVCGAIQNAPTTSVRMFLPYDESTGTRQTPFGYAGEMEDENGLVYLRARYYNRDTGTFPSLDPYEGDISNPMSLNRYIYVYDNPVNLVDPSGMIAEKDTSILSQYNPCTYLISDCLNCTQYLMDGNMPAYIDCIRQCEPLQRSAPPTNTPRPQTQPLPTPTYTVTNPCASVTPFPVFGQGLGHMATKDGYGYGQLVNGKIHAALDVVPSSVYPADNKQNWPNDPQYAEYATVYAVVAGEIRTLPDSQVAQLQPNSGPLKNRWEFLYAHVDLSVGLGQIVGAGDPIGRVATVSSADVEPLVFPHLHFAIRQQNKPYSDPDNYADPNNCLV